MTLEAALSPCHAPIRAKGGDINQLFATQGAVKARRHGSIRMVGEFAFNSRHKV